MPDGSATDLRNRAGAPILEIQRAAFLRHGAPDLAHRRAALKRLKGAILGNRARLEAAAQEDFGVRSPIETDLIDIGPTIQSINHMRANLGRWMKPRHRPTPMLMQPGKSVLHHQPVGIVGILSAWNYPVALALVPLATALAAGNRVMLKTSELAPATADVLAEMLDGAFAPDEVATITGDAELAAAFTTLPFDHLFFTGSTDVGRRVMRAAAENLTPVTLELGGKSPAILCDDADFVLAAGDIAFGKTANAGQTCIAPDYLLLPENRVPAFIEAFTAAIERSFPGGLADPALTTIASARHHARLNALLADAAAKGAEIHPVLSAHEGAHPRAMAPTLVLNATDDMLIMQEEIFGPLLPVLSIGSIEAAIERVNRGSRPLALYVYGKDRTAIDRVLAGTTSGNVTVNGTLLHYAVDTLPFGGVGDSGIGAYHGVEGFRRLSHAKGVFHPGRRHGARLLRPPYGSLAKLVRRLMLR
ncbi:coniferyl-aldehyde dehydrogenase [Aliiruegeria haliotis]|uniref:Aldehyde dehydrogenase n=1 Tax=Aliiruegeria haliotis TaxID=1280846 RepID=A0A2T0RR34_9RHOB|nr:coniferyl aldehyde dehydrogenase [Aliiruegeria haliotis]PRY23628.1 coniferyl-aldehyde dehydrogenase [Aliiruegeria haliotis]